METAPEFTLAHRDELLQKAYASYLKIQGIEEEMPSGEELIKNHFGIAVLSTIVALEELKVMTKEDIVTKGQFEHLKPKIEIVQ